MVVHTYNPSTWETEAGGSSVGYIETLSFKIIIINQDN
jgi:hypothetical protein